LEVKDTDMNRYENENNWSMRNYTDIYNRCIKMGHRIVVISVRDNHVLTGGFINPCTNGLKLEQLLQLYTQ
jgi:hypothetical protein